jgi:hypothetical protein
MLSPPTRVWGDWLRLSPKARICAAAAGDSYRPRDRLAVERVIFFCAVAAGAPNAGAAVAPKPPKAPAPRHTESYNERTKERFFSMNNALRGNTAESNGAVKAAGRMSP